MRVCILARPCPGSWVDHYIAAFARRCEVLVVGPDPDAPSLRAWGRETHQGTYRRVDIPCDFAEAFDLNQLLPLGWRPDLVVGISGLGGAPLYQGVATLTCPTAYITVDTWQCLYDYSDARGYDFVFAAQRAFLPHLQATGSHRVYWLPLACDPAAHYPTEEAPTHDIAFAGSASRPVHQARRLLLEALSARHSVLMREGVFGETLNETFARGRLAFNHCAVREVNMRVFEAMAMGRPLLTNAEAEENGLLDLFQDGVDCVVYDSEADLMRRVDCLLTDEAARTRMALAGYAKVQAEHTYDHRVDQLLRVVADHCPKTWTDRAEWACRGNRLHDYLPLAPGVVADYGLGLQASRIALRHRGVDRLIGLALGEATTRRASYDELVLEGGPQDRAVDTFAIDGRGKSAAFLSQALATAHAKLVPGGNLVVAIDGSHLQGEDILAWLLAQGFHGKLQSPPLEGGGHILVARKRTRALRGIVEQLFNHLQIPEMDIPALCARIPETW